MNNIKQHQEMGYDRSVGMFSPDGLLLQVEYAEKAVRLGSCVLGITTKQGIVFIAERKIKSKLLIKKSFKKIFEVDNHILIAGAGVMSDGRRLIEQSQVIAQEHFVKFQNPIDILSLVKDVANIQQYYSQTGGLRPFGVHLLIGGVENNCVKLYQTMASGIFMQYKAICIGNLSDKINEKLEKLYKDDLTNKKALQLGLKLFKETLENDFDIEKFDFSIIDLDNNIQRLDSKEVEKLI